ncbi:unnamed protein product, partial [Meganyctiphanes norvegica]
CNINDLKNKIFTKENYVECPYETCIMKIYVDHLEKHVQDHEWNASNVGKEKCKRRFLCVECGSRHHRFYSISKHIFNHFNSNSEELSQRKLTFLMDDNIGCEVLNNSEIEISSNYDSSDDEYMSNSKLSSNSDSSDQEYTTNSKLKNRARHQSVIKNQKFKNNSVTCNSCGKLCNAGEQYEVHMKNYHIENLCETCGGIFIGNFALKKHICSNHKINISCRICGETFEKKADRKNHIKLLHKDHQSEIKKIICDICGKLVNTSYLSEHLQWKHSN